MAMRHLIILCLFAIILTSVLTAKLKVNKKFLKEVVKRHNQIRKMHGVKKVKGNKNISKFAQKWANYLNDYSKFEHRSLETQKYGENLSWMSAEDATGADHVDNLYTKEEQFYSDLNYYGIEPPMSNFTHYGHFTQIVWKRTKKIGVGIAGPVVVINYSPAGNTIGKFSDNVFDKS